MFITFEGIEGAGKGTVIEKLSQWLLQKGYDCLLTRQPGGSELGVIMRSLLLDIRHDVVPEAELFMYLADRAQHVQKVIRPALAKGEVVLCDRYADSTTVYQGFGRGLCVEDLERLNEMAVGGLWPELTILLDLPPDVGLSRARKRNKELGLDVTEGKFEAEKMDFHHKIRNGYLHFAAKHANRFVVINANMTPDAVFAAVVAQVERRLTY